MNSLETLGGLARRLHVSVPLEQIDTEIQKRLKRLASAAKIPGFRPGKVPLRMIAQQYGVQVRSEVLSEAVQETFADAVRTQNLHVAGHPKIEPKPLNEGSGKFEYDATFEVYPEVVLSELSEVTIFKPVVEIGPADIERTIDILRKQRVKFEPVDREVQNGDRVVTDFTGTVDGIEFPGGQAKDFPITLGEGVMLPEFESALLGTRVGERKTFRLVFPDDYHGAEVASKTAEFNLTVKEILKPVLPPVDAEFAKAFGIADGDLEKLRSDIKTNVELELKRKIEANLHDQAIKALKQVATLTVPNSLVEQEIMQMRQRALADVKAQGASVDEAQITPEMFRSGAEERVRIGLILAEVVNRNNLRASPEEVRSRVVEAAQSYEQPDAVVAWHYQESERLAEFEAQALDHNVVQWVLSRVKVEERPTTFAELVAAKQPS